MTKTAVALVLVLLAATPALALDPAQTFRQGATLLSVEGGGGHQANLEGHRVQTGLDLWYASVRYSLVMFDPAGPGLLRGAFEAGMGPIIQKYDVPGGNDALFGGLGVQARWHLLSFGRFVPYVEGGAAAGGQDLRVREIDSNLALLLNVGAGASVLLTDRTAIYAGYRLMHVSNGNTDDPNRGFEAHTGVLGFSYFFK